MNNPGSTDYAALRPDQWAMSHPEAIRQYRREDRRDRDTRQAEPSPINPRKRPQLVNWL